MPTRLNFYERAAKLGHSIERLRAGEKIVSKISICDVDALKEFLDCGLMPVERQELAQDLFGDVPETDPKKDPTPEGILRRVEGFLYGNQDLSELDRKRIAPLFPMEVDATSIDKQTVNTPQNLGTGGTMAYVNIHELTLENGGYYILYNKPLTFVVDTLIRNGGG